MREHRAIWLAAVEPSRDHLAEARKSCKTAAEAHSKAARAERDAVLGYVAGAPFWIERNMEAAGLDRLFWFKAWAALYRRVAREMERRSMAGRLRAALRASGGW